MTSSTPSHSSSGKFIKCDLDNQSFSSNNLATNNHEDETALKFKHICIDEPLDFSLKKCTKDTKILTDDSESNGSRSYPENNGINFPQSNSLKHPLANKSKTTTAVHLKKIDYYGTYQAQPASIEVSTSPKNCDLENVGPNTTYPFQKALISTEEIQPKVFSGVQTVPAFQVMQECSGNSHHYMCSPPLTTHSQFDPLAGPSNSYITNTSILPVVFGESKKKARPFKAYQFEADRLNYFSKIPIDIGLSLDSSITQTLINTSSNEAFQEFREKALAQKKLEREKAQKSKTETVNKQNAILSESNESNESNGDESIQKANIQPVSSTESSTSRNATSRKRSKALPDELKDDVYWEKRRKNNEAAKRSRDARRRKEDEIAIKASFFEQENMQLKIQIANLRKETATLKYLLCRYNSTM